MVELGAREAIMTAPDGCYAQMVPEEPGGAPRRSTACACARGAVEPRATVGSGDAFLAGFVAARYNGRSTEECLVYGVACGAESTQHLGAGLVDPGQVERLLDESRSSARCSRRGRLSPELRKPAGSVVAATLPSAPTPRIPSWK